MADNPRSVDLLRVARPRECNTQQTPLERATGAQHVAQHVGLKALALLALGRNSQRNNTATSPQKTAQQTGVSECASVARDSEPLHPGWTDWRVIHADGSIVHRFEPDHASRAEVMVATCACDAEEVPRWTRPATPSEAEELRRLCALVFINDGPEVVAEAVALALADAFRALRCYRRIAAKLGIGNPQDSGTPKRPPGG